MNLKSITASWIIAMCLLGLVSLLNQPVATEEAKHEQLFMLPEEQAPVTEAQVSELEAYAWCALSSNQQVQYRYRGSLRTAQGAMGINPDWLPPGETQPRDQHMQECEQLRIGQLALARDDGATQSNPRENPAMQHLFTTL